MNTTTKLEAPPLPEFIGPRALFDPSFVPPAIHGRDKELRQLSSFLSDSLEDDFSASVVVCGLPGMGKGTLINRAVGESGARATTVEVDCRSKIVEEILGSLITGVARTADLTVDGLTLVNRGTPSLWNTLRLVARKQVAATENLTLVLRSINYIEDGYLQKFCRFGKEVGVNVLATWENYGYLNDTSILKGVDFRSTLRPLACRDLFRVSRDRIKYAIPCPVDDDVPALIVDLVDEFSVRAPGACIDLIKDIYPEIKSGGCTFDPDHLRDRLRFHVSEPGNAPSELDLMSYIEESDFLLKIFIDEISHLFRQVLYASSGELRSRYYVACEVVGVEKSTREFWDFVSVLKGMGILFPSKLADDQYYLLPAPDDLERVLDVLFTGV
ncbi:MAG: hypothetical protein ACTSU5_16205 [Promethearchaeota archaeon]